MNPARVAGVLMLPLCLLAQTFPGSTDLDNAIEEAITAGQIPGAVLLAGLRDGTILHLKAYGARALTPAREAMTTDTIFDAASLTKVVATTASIMKLVERGKVRLNERVTQHLPGFQGGSSDITVRHLLTHFSGMRPDLDLKPEWSGYDTGIRKALVDHPVAAPGERFIYSDINFILLGEIVRKVSGKPLEEFALTEIFIPLGMKETMFQPPPELRSRIAPTEKDPATGAPLRGVVHDTTTRFMRGVAGHAGLFTTAADLAKFAEMMLNLGQRKDVRLFSPLTVRKFTSPQTPPDQPVLRGLGFDMDSPFSGNRGDLYPLGSYGHTGFTGTSLWMDPATGSYVALLANSVHPDRRPPITSLRGRVATVVAASLGVDAPGILLTGYGEAMNGIRRTVNRNAQVLTGLDVLAAEGFAPLRGKRVGLITNHTGLSRDGRRNVDLMAAAGLNVTALFSPEHGMAGTEDHEKIGHSRDAATGIPVWSLYQGQSRRPSPEMLSKVDLLVFDIQDVGARFYTYSCTMRYAFEEAAKLGLPVWLLDRPNPITGAHMEGPMLDADLHSFVGCFSIPLRHGLTMGELAGMLKAELGGKLDLHVVQLKNWRRGDWFDATGLTWVNPSPNMRSLNAALLYPGLAMIEASRNYSVGRGTDAPFEQIGADWIEGRKLAAFLNARMVPGVRMYPVKFKPVESHYKGVEVEGVRFVITDREVFDSVRLGLELGSALEKLYPGRIPWDDNQRLIGSKSTSDAIRTGRDPRLIHDDLHQAVKDFADQRTRYLLYP